jgi:hypothetical protein
MSKSLDEIMAQLPQEYQEQINARAKQLIAEEKTRRELKKAYQLTQVKIAKISEFTVVNGVF